MRVLAALTGNLDEYMAQEIRDAQIGVTRGISAATDGLKAELRAQVTGAGLGERLARTWQSQVYPKGRESANAGGFVWSAAPDLIGAFDRGVTIRSADGFFLAIPTALAGPVRGAKWRPRMTPGEWERRRGMRLRFVYRHGRPSLLVADGVRIGKSGWAKANISNRGGAPSTRLAGSATAVIFILLPQVRLKKRLDVKPTGDKWQARVPNLVLDSWPD